MLYSCTHLATVGVKGLLAVSDRIVELVTNASQIWHPTRPQQVYPNSHRQMSKQSYDMS